MNKIILKYSLSSTNSDDIMITPPGGVFSINIIKSAKILSLGVQNEIGQLWVNADINMGELEKRYFALFMTGMGYEDTGLEYIGTYTSNGLVLHLFEKV